MSWADRGLENVRLIHLLLAFILPVQPALAENVQVPLLADGTVNVEEVLTSFKLSFPILEAAPQATDFTGELLGQPFAGGVIGADTMHDLALVIHASTLSEHGNFLIAVLVTDAICHRNGGRPGPVLWSERRSHDGGAWQVPISCAAATD